jgi:hypothetical protein
MRVQVTYVKKASYSASIELDDGEIMDRFIEAVNQEEPELNGTDLQMSLSIDIEGPVTDLVEAGLVEDEQQVSQEDIELEDLS